VGLARCIDGRHGTDFCPIGGYHSPIHFHQSTEPVEPSRVRQTICWIGNTGTGTQTIFANPNPTFELKCRRNAEIGWRWSFIFSVASDTDLNNGDGGNDY